MKNHDSIYPDNRTKEKTDSTINTYFYRTQTTYNQNIRRRNGLNRSSRLSKTFQKPLNDVFKPSIVDVHL